MNDLLTTPSMKILLLVNILHILVQFGQAQQLDTISICGNVEISGERGYIISPNYPENYYNGLVCFKSISPPPGKRVEIVVVTAELEIEESACGKDNLTLVVGNETYSGATFCGNHIPLSFTTSEIVTIYLKTGLYGTAKGFRIYWVMVDDCDANSFRCWDGSCIPSTQRCDGNSDCPNNSDEIECAHVPTSYGECGKNAAPVGFTWDYRIVGGNRALANSYPWTVPLYNGDNNYFCVATIISEEWLMTAAHCVTGKSSRDLYGLLGTNNITNFNSTRVQFDSIHIHPDYARDDVLVNDIALLRTSVPIVFNDRVNPVCLPTNESSVVDNEVCISVGWGSFYSGGSLNPDLLHQVRLPLANKTICRTAFPGVSAAHLGAGDYEKGGRDTCQGDSGGPLLCYRGGSWFQFGITSFGAGCGNVASPGVYTNVRSYSSWVEDVQSISSIETTTTNPPPKNPTTANPTTANPTKVTTANTTTVTTVTMIQSTVESMKNLFYQIGSNLHPIARLFSFWWENGNDNSRLHEERTEIGKSNTEGNNFDFVNKIIQKIHQHNAKWSLN